MKCVAGGLRRICRALILPLNTTLIKTEISDDLDKQPEVLLNWRHVNRRLNKKCKKTSQGLQFYRELRNQLGPENLVCVSDEEVVSLLD